MSGIPMGKRPRRLVGDPARWTLTARITVLTAAVALLLAGVAAGAAISANTNNNYVDIVFDQISPVRNDSQAILVAVLNQETGLRGYAIDGDPAGLAPYTEGMQDQSSLSADIMKHTKPTSTVAADLREVNRLTVAWRTAIADPVIAEVRAGNEAGARALLDNSSKTQFDAVRAAVDKLQNDVLAMRDVAVKNLQDTSSQIVWELSAAAIIVILGGIVLTILLRRFVIRPVDRLAASVRIVASGDYGAAIDTTGPPELARLGSDVDDMRQRILADLRLVERASELVASANAALEQQAADLLRSNEDLEQFAYVASHDLQEPLRKVASFCQLLQRRYANQLDERADQYISFAVDGANRMQRLINDLLKFSRIGRATSDFTAVNLGTLVGSVVEANQTIEKAGGTVSVSDLPVIEGDESLLVALFTNLIGNSVKFRRTDEPLRITIDAREIGDDWEITCADNGIGIEPEYADKIFVIFQRLHARDAYPGTGIGLAIAKRIVEYHGGRIRVDTGVDSGATIRFTLPVRRPASTESEVVAPVEREAVIG